MKRIASVIQRIGGGFDAFAKRGRAEYRLDKCIVPDYAQIKQAHQLLLKEYVRAIAAVTRLSFFVALHEIQLPKGRLLEQLFDLLLVKYTVFRLVTLKPLVRYFVETHIAEKLSELSVAYVQTEFLVQNSLSNSSEYIHWLKEARRQCDDFQKTLSSAKAFFNALRSIGASILVLLLAVLGVNSLSDLVLKILLNSLPATSIALIAIVVTMLVVASLYVYLFWDSAFRAKRAIFSGIGSDVTEDHNVYMVENDLFQTLGRGKSREWPWDYLFPLSFALCMTAILLWLQNQVDRAFSTQPHVVILPCISMLSLPFIAVLIVDVIIPWYKRHAKGNM